MFYNDLTYSFCIVLDGYKYMCLYVVSYIIYVLCEYICVAIIVFMYAYCVNVCT